MSSILYLVPDLFGPPGGIARYCRLVAQALGESGVAVHIVALMDQPHDAARLPQATAAVAPLNFAAGATYTPCGGSRTAFIRQAVRQTLRTRPGLILTGHVNLAPLGWALARLTRAPMVTFAYGIDAWAPLSRTRHLALQRSARVIAISRYTADRAMQINALDPARLRVLHNCLDPQFERSQASHSPGNSSEFLPVPSSSPEFLRVPSDQPFGNYDLSLLTVARMSLAEQYKGHDVVLHAMPELLQRFPDLRYDIIGDGDARPGLQALAQQLGVAPAVHFHGVVSEAALRDHYAQASLFIMPSRAEGFGFVFLEAMAHGLPVIGGNMDATPEVVVHKETGLLADPTSPTQIADAIATLLADPLRRQIMGIAAQHRVEEHFSFSQFQQHLLAILAELVALTSIPS